MARTKRNANMDHFYLLADANRLDRSLFKFAYSEAKRNDLSGILSVPSRLKEIHAPIGHQLATSVPGVSKQDLLNEIGEKGVKEVLDRPFKGCTPLDLAIACDNPDAIRELLEMGADPNNRSGLETEVKQIERFIHGRFIQLGCISGEKEFAALKKFKPFCMFLLEKVMKKWIFGNNLHKKAKFSQKSGESTLYFIRDSFSGVGGWVGLTAHKTKHLGGG